MKYCVECGHPLIKKELHNEGMIPYCPSCNEYRFPTFNSAISTVILNKEKTKVLLIQQYGKPSNILVAGYINKGENANEALLREVKEEVGLDIIKYIYNDNVYFERSNTLIHNYISFVEEENFHTNEEIDQAKWFTIKEAIQTIRPNSLAKQFLIQNLCKLGYSRELLQYEANRIYILNAYDEIVAEVAFHENDTYCDIYHTYVDPYYRNLNIASTLMEAVCELIASKHKTIQATCSYASYWLNKQK